MNMTTKFKTRKHGTVKQRGKVFPVEGSLKRLPTTKPLSPFKRYMIGIHTQYTVRDLDDIEERIYEAEKRGILTSHEVLKLKGHLDFKRSRL